MIKAVAIIGARPNFIKHFPIEQACKNKLKLVTIHTGQHFDENMSKVFFDGLGLSKPDYHLKTDEDNHGQQIGDMLIKIEGVVVQEKPDLVMVYGDTNTTLAGALVASKLQIPIAHIEAGLRSFNKEMPEETNRVMTDHLSKWLFCPSGVAVENLKREGIKDGVYIIGDLMKDMVNYALNYSKITDPKINYEYNYVTLHRPYNVDDKERLNKVLHALNLLDKKCIFTVHPRTKIRMRDYGIDTEVFSNITFIEPQPYFENLGYIYHSNGLITDSGGMQKEAYWLKKKCITLRPETEWIETLANKCNELVFEDLALLSKINNQNNLHFDEELYGTGTAAQNIVEILSC